MPSNRLELCHPDAAPAVDASFAVCAILSKEEKEWELNKKNISIIIIELNRKIVISPEKTVYSGRLKINNAI